MSEDQKTFSDLIDAMERNSCEVEKLGDAIRVYMGATRQGDNSALVNSAMVRPPSEEERRHADRQYNSHRRAELAADLLKSQVVGSNRASDGLAKECASAARALFAALGFTEEAF